MPGDDARTQRLVVLTVWQLVVALLALVAAVAAIAWGAANAYRDVIERIDRLDRKLSERLREQTNEIQGLKYVVDDVKTWRDAEMDRRSDEAARQRQRKEWCKAGAAKGQACINLLSEGEIEALEGK